jgi:hypothetical protein
MGSTRNLAGQRYGENSRSRERRWLPNSSLIRWDAERIVLAHFVMRFSVSGYFRFRALLYRDIHRLKIPLSFLGHIFRKPPNE